MADQTCRLLTMYKYRRLFFYCILNHKKRPNYVNWVNQCGQCVIAGVIQLLKLTHILYQLAIKEFNFVQTLCNSISKQ